MTDDKNLVDAYASIYNKKEEDKEQVNEVAPIVAAGIGLGKKLLMNKKNIYIPIKVVPYIFVSIATITIAFTTNFFI